MSQYINCITITVKRNLKGFPFPASMNPKHMRMITAEIIKCIGANLIHINEPEAKELLAKYDTGFDVPRITDPVKYDLITRNCFVAEFEGVLLKVNTSNHLEIIIRTSGDLNLAYLQYANAYNIIDFGLSKPFSYSQNYGFCTSSIKDLGTGMRITAKLHCPDDIRRKQLIELPFTPLDDLHFIILDIRSNPTVNEQMQFDEFKNKLEIYHKIMSQVKIP